MLLDNSKHLLFGFCIYYLIVNVAFAAPSISSISGTVSNGETITISGSNFGSKSAAAPLRSSYDNATSAYNWSTGSLHSDWIKHDNGIDLTNSNPRNNNYQSRYKVTYPADGGYDDVGLNSNTAHDKVYVSWWMYRDNETLSISSGGGANSKFLVIYQATEGTCKVILNVDTNDDAGFYREFTCEDTWDLSYGGTGSGYYSASKGASDRWSLSLGDATPENTMQSWEHWEVYLDYPSTNYGGDGIAILWKNGATVGRSTSIRIAESPCLNDARYFRIGQVSGGRDTSYNEYLDQVYIDNTVAHVFIGDSNSISWPDEESTHHTEVQVCSSWSDTSITLSVNQGTFQCGDTCYLYVVDSSGDISNGYQINMDCSRIKGVSLIGVSINN